MKTVIRIEHPYDGRGLWRSRRENDELRILAHSEYDTIEKRHHTSDFPTFWEDRGLQEAMLAVNEEAEPRPYHFAFKSIEQLNSALTKSELKECITKLGYRVWMLDVTCYHESKYQVIFKKESIISSKDISSLFI